MQANPRFKQILKALETAEVPTGRNAKMAFWINVYNVLAIDVVLDKYPVKSINDVGGWFKKVWDIDAGIVAGQMVSLNYVEHEVLRKMGDFRIHAAIVCASVSCPDIRAEAFTAHKLDVQLDEQMLLWLANPDKGARLDTFGRFIEISKIFDWFGEDFTKGGKTVLESIAHYLPPSTSAALNDDTKVKYLDYDWSLNDSLRF